MKVTLTDDEVSSVRVAIRLAETAHTELVSMSPSKEVRQMFMAELRHLHSVDKKLGA